MEPPKTKTIVALTNALTATTKQLFIVDAYRDVFSEEEFNKQQQTWNLELSARNIESAMVLGSNEISVYWLLKQNKVIITKEALATLEEVLG